MKIAILASSYPRFAGDGTAPFVKSISEHLAKHGHQVEVIAPNDPEVRTGEQGTVTVHRFRYIWPERLSIMGHARSLEADVRLHPLSYLLLPLFLLSAFFKLMAVTGRQQSQAIYVHWVIPNGPVAVLVAAWRKIPFIISLHGSDMYLARKNKLFGRVARWVFRRSAGVTACSAELRQAALALGAPPETLLLAWGADPQLFSPALRSDDLRKKYLRADTDLLLLGLGRMVPKKGFEVLLEALPQVISSYPNLHLVLAGGGALQEKLEARAAELGLRDSVTFSGRVPWTEVPGLLASTDIFALPSQRDKSGNIDGLPTVLPEAMASGAAVVASDIGGVNLIVESGKNGILVAPGDAHQLATAITALAGAAEKRRLLASAARKAVEEKFNWDQVALEIERLLLLACWQSGLVPRLGTVYRDEMVKYLQDDKALEPAFHLSPPPESGRILDVGCHDGYWLSTIAARIRIGVDPEPIGGAPGIDFVQADGTAMPFRDAGFDLVYAMDVIEHVPDDASFARALQRMVAPGGQLFLSTPSAQIRLTPGFLTGWISRQWGHYLRLGYSAERLRQLFDSGMDITIHAWNAPAYRFWYLPIRLLSTIAPRWAASLVRRIARYDARHIAGEHGFILLTGIKPGSDSEQIGNNP